MPENNQAEMGFLDHLEELRWRLVRSLSAIIIGSIGGLVSGSGILLLEKIKVDDVVSAIPVHLFAGTWATLAVAIFTDNSLL